jgi:peptidoglycan hydrolase-like protein with peptidoglycan-binding domain
MMAAAPHIPFGTKICIPTFGCGAVHDRGQAIVRQGDRRMAQHDRLDLWMGYGDQGLLRALAWGVQHLEGTQYPAGAPIAESVNLDVPLPLAQIINLPDRLIFSQNLSLGASGELVISLQEILKKLGSNVESLDGIFDDSLERAVLVFQMKHYIIESAESVGAGILGPKTREKLAEVWYRFEIQKHIAELWEEFHFEEDFKRGLRNEAVLKLQQILVQAEFMEVQPTGYFGPKTEAALTAFQLHHDLIQAESESGAGKVGPKTRAKLNETLLAEKDALKAEQRQVVAYQQKRSRWNQLASSFDFASGIILTQGDGGDSVRNLQESLVQLGYFQHRPTGQFGPLTRGAVQRFQLDHGVISHSRARGAGMLGPRTRTMLQAVLRG